MSCSLGPRSSESDVTEQPGAAKSWDGSPYNNSRGHLMHLNLVRSLFATVMQARGSDFQFSPNFSIKIGLEAPGNVRAALSFGGLL
jgi:hypothetical protein